MSGSLSSLFNVQLHIPSALLDMPNADAGKGWSDYLAQIGERLTDREFAQGFYSAVPVNGADPSEYNYRLIQTQGVSIVCSLRFKALNASEPFIEILLCDRPLDRETITWISSVVKDEYSRFRPGRLRYLSLDDAPLWPEDQEDFAVFVGDIATLQAQPYPDRYNDLELLPSKDLEFYPHLLRNYEGLFREKELTPEPASSLGRSLEQGLLYEAFLGGQWAGMMAAHRMTERFYSGIFIVEEIIDERLRGQGYAPAMQRKFIDQLEPGGIVFGEILWWNERSRRTAQRVGRKKCGTTFFHSIK